MHKKYKKTKGIFWGQIPFPKFPFKINVQNSGISKKTMVTTFFTFFLFLEHYDKNLFSTHFFPKVKREMKFGHL